MPKVTALFECQTALYERLTSGVDAPIMDIVPKDHNTFPFVHIFEMRSLPTDYKERVSDDETCQGETITAALHVYDQSKGMATGNRRITQILNQILAAVTFDSDKADEQNFLEIPGFLVWSQTYDTITTLGINLPQNVKMGSIELDFFVIPDLQINL
jgi:hypothetical protein